MTFNELSSFLRNRMRMSHIYQPVMIRTLLRNEGKCNSEEIAKAILAHDQSQVDYYRKITHNMVGRVLRRHSIVEKQEQVYRLVGFENLSEAEKKALDEICIDKLQEYKEKRGKAIWEHRTNSAGYISGTLRYEVLRRAKFRCELCGISADEKALEVDHIVPRSKGGSDEISNLQALCYSCNAMKRDRDDTDFRGYRKMYDQRDAECVFCNEIEQRVILENTLAIAIRDAFPVTEHHTLIIPKRHTPSYFDLGRPEVNACNLLLEEMRVNLLESDPSIEGFNIGINESSVAGQTISHCHIHLIPRREGDVANPKGGVRNVISGKGDY